MGGLDRMGTRQGEPATGDPQADQLLQDDGNAVLVGVLLDQQVRAEVAFTGPLKIRQRLGHLDMTRIAEADPEELIRAFSEKPAVHRFPKMMASRVQALAQEVSQRYQGHASAIWDGIDVPTLRKRASALPGFGKAKVHTLLHALQLFGHRPDIEVEASD